MVIRERERANSVPDEGSAAKPLPHEQAEWDDLVEAGEEDVPTIILYVVAGLLLLSFTLYLALGGGHSHFH